MKGSVFMLIVGYVFFVAIYSHLWLNAFENNTYLYWVSLFCFGISLITFLILHYLEQLEVGK